MKLAIVLLAAAATASAMTQVHAGACPSHQLAILSPTRTNAPTNSVVRVQFDGPGVEVVELVDETTRQIKKSGMASIKTAVVSLRAGAKTIDATAITDANQSRPTITLTPKSALAANTTYSVVVDDFIVGSFTTGTGADTTPPSLEPIAKAGYFRWKGSTPPHWKDPDGTFAELGVKATDAIGFEIFDHEPKAGDRPSAFVVGGTTLALGVVDSCRMPTYAIPQKATKLELWVRAYDAANQTSAARAVSIDLRRPKAR